MSNRISEGHAALRFPLSDIIKQGTHDLINWIYFRVNVLSSGG